MSRPHDPHQLRATEELCREHLIAEYRELPRVFGMVRGMIARGQADTASARIPPAYRMGAGHMAFFCDKLGYLVERQRALIAEMRPRGYAPQYTDPEALLEGIPPLWRGDWAPDADALAINRARIAERLPKPRRINAGTTARRGP
jgi:hypothetical protein